MDYSLNDKKDLTINNAVCHLGFLKQSDKECLSLMLVVLVVAHGLGYYSEVTQ